MDLNYIPFVVEKFLQLSLFNINMAVFMFVFAFDVIYDMFFFCEGRGGGAEEL